LQIPRGESNNLLEQIVIGSIAETLGVSGFGYQLSKMIKTHDTKSITYLMMAFLGIGVSMWATYGVIQNDPVIYATNIIMTGILVGMVSYKMKRERIVNIQELARGTI